MLTNTKTLAPVCYYIFQQTLKLDLLESIVLMNMKSYLKWFKKIELEIKPLITNDL